MYNPDVRILEALIEQGARLSVENAEQETLLHLAARTVRPDILKLLLNKDSTRDYPKLQTANGESPVLCALTSAIDALEMITLAGDATTLNNCQAANNASETSLHLAIKADDVERIEYFIEKGCLNERIKEGLTALHLAVSEGGLGTVKLLINPGADVYPSINHGLSVLQLAVSSHIEKLAAILSARRIESVINQQDNNGLVAIHMVIEGSYLTESNVEMMKNMLEIPAFDANLTDGEGRTPICHLASRMKTQKYSQEDISKATRLLLNRGVESNKANGKGATALHELCDKGITPPVTSTMYTVLEKALICCHVTEKACWPSIWHSSISKYETSKVRDFQNLG
ncbi:hypothetical protein MMC21_005687 [Puttea exsequens]|nr:hypothetical protein [Puttea exsequens]